jgi:hypothetical protein
MEAIDVRRPAPRSLADVRDPDGDTFPVELLEGCHTGLVLFAARWHGRQDAIHLADAGLEGTAVDIDESRLVEMARVYPDDWDFYVDDVFEFAGEHHGVERWDVVTLDPFSELFDRVAALADLWTGLANRVVILGVGVETTIRPPAGWRIVLRRRRSSFAGGVYWVALTR